jgi:nucleotide-binding universal stress UspA family protein
VPQSVPLSQSDAELSDAAPVHPRSTAFTDDPDSGDEQGLGTDAETEDDELTDDDDFLDPETLANTEKNAHMVPDNPATQDVEEPDPLGEGVNVVVPHEPYFPTAFTERSARGKKDKGPKRRKTLKPEPLPFQTSRPVFQRDRCTLSITQGDPDGKLAGRSRRRYMIASDLGEESRYALEWGIGTVLRDGDELLVVHIIENESKVDPPTPGTIDRTLKLRSQQERQGFSYILVRQSTSLLQRTRLNVRIVCQAWHAKNARHMLLDIADYYEPIMLVVGSRGLGRLSG